MKYLITGITGFAGPNLANHLIKQGHEVYGLIRDSNGREQDIRDVVPDENFKKINFVYGDFTRQEDMENIFTNNQYNGVFHLGAQSHPPTSFKDPKGTRITNVEGTKNIMDSIEQYQDACALMFCSTSEVYGAPTKEAQGEKGISEDFPYAPMNPYGLSKAITDVECLGRARISKEKAKADKIDIKLPFFVTRAFSHTGLRRGNKFSISSDAYQLSRIKKGLQDPTISVGNLSSKRAVMDVKDCVGAYSLLMDLAVQKDERVIGEAFNVGGDELFSMRELLDHMINISGLEGKLKEYVNPAFVRKIDIPVQICDTSKLRNLTGWKPEISIIDQTLPELLEYWDKKIN